MSEKIAVVTGNQGFIGSWVTLGLLRSGWKVIGVDNRSSLSGDRWADAIQLENKVSAQYAEDICNTDAIGNILGRHRPILVVNMAGQAIVPRAFKEPLETFRTNTFGTLSVLEASRLAGGVKAVVSATSDKVYLNNDQVWPFRESDTLGGKDIYSASKACAELVCTAYSKTHLVGTGINVQTVRLGNVVGGGDWSRNRLIPDLMNSLVERKQFYIRYPLATRPFQHVLDVVDGVLNIANAALDDTIPSGEGWNLGPKNNTVAMVKDVVDLCQKAWPQISIEQTPNQVAEDLNLSVEVVKYRKRFGTPVWTSLEAIERTVSWYQNFFDKADQFKLLDNEFEVYEKEKSRV